MHTDADGQRTDADGRRTDSARTADGHCIFVTMTICRSVIGQRTECGRTALSVRCPSTVRPHPSAVRPPSVRIRPLSVRCPYASVRCPYALSVRCPSAVCPGFLTCPSAERTDSARMRTAADGMSPLLLIQNSL